MRLTEAYIENFGKLHNKHIRFSPGINVIYGENEAGKSTLQEFLTAMLFGMEPQRGRNKEKDLYAKYEPWNAGSYFCGNLRFEVDGRPFLLNRNFYHKEKTAKLTNEADGEELSVEFGDLSMLLGDISKEAFLNTSCIRQTGAATNKELAKILIDYMSNVENTGDANISFEEALKKLDGKRKEIQKEKKDLLQEKNDKEKHLRVQEQIVLSDIEQLKEQIENEKLNIELTSKELKKEYENKKSIENSKSSSVQYKALDQHTIQEKKNKKKSTGGLIDIVLSALMALFNILFYGRYPFSVWILVEFLFVIVTILQIILFEKRKKQSEEELKNEEVIESRLDTSYASPILYVENKIRKLETELERHKSAILVQKNQMQDKELTLINIRESLDEIDLITSKEQENTKCEQAIRLAQETMQRLAKDVSKDIRHELYLNASKILAEITDGKYTELSFDDELAITVSGEQKKLPIYALSRGTMEQIYFAVRMAFTEILEEEQMFFSFDETFAMYDDDRLTKALQYISKKSNQCLIFTCNQREIQTLEKNNIMFHKISLDGKA